MLALRQVPIHLVPITLSHDSIAATQVKSGVGQASGYG